MPKYITFDIKALENIKMGRQGGQYDTEYALDYIAGSSIRGAYINRYMKEFNVKDINKGNDKNKLLLGEMKFLNAYPKAKGSRSIPFPSCFYTLKDNLKLFETNKTLKLTNEFQVKKMDGNYEKVRLTDFCIYNAKNEEYEVVNVDKVFNLHITKRKEENNLYRYESIRKGQEFSGIIVAENEEIAQECKQLIENNVFYFGGSKGSGYGKCIIDNVKIQQHNTEYIGNIEEEDFQGEFYVIALSDLILRNSFGQVISHIDEKYLKEKLKLDSVELVESSIDTNITSGYNSHWMCRLPQIIGVKRGSIFKYEYNGIIEKDKLLKLLNDGVGDRRVEGFGRIAILGSILGGALSKNNNVPLKVNEPKELTKQEKIQLQEVINRIYKNKIEKYTSSKILELESKLKNSNVLADSQWGKLIELASNYLFLTPKEGKDQFRSYLNNIKDRNNNRDLIHRYEKVKVGEQSLLEFLEEFTCKLDDIQNFNESFEKYVAPIRICGLEPILTKEYVYRSNLEFLGDFIQLKQRKEGVE